MLNVYFTYAIRLCDYFSDDRSVEVFRQRIESATQIHSIGNEEKLPNCLLIDEIDGAPTVSILLLLNPCKCDFIII